MKDYLNILKEIMINGEDLPNRTGIPTRSLFGVMFSHDMRTGFPLLTTKKVNIQAIAVELEGFIKGITDKKWYQERKCFIWDEWCNPQILKKYDWSNPLSVFTEIKNKNNICPSLSPKVNKMIESIDVGNMDTESIKKLVQLYENDLGPIYGYQWRRFGKQYTVEHTDENTYTYNAFNGVDQLKTVIETLKANPFDRRMLVSAWNPIEVENQSLALPACHWAFQVKSNGVEFDLMFMMRSNDMFLGSPFNIASYGLLMKLIEKEVGLVARHLKCTIGDAHIYHNHFEQVEEQTNREPRVLPTLTIPNNNFSIYEWTYNDIELTDYNPHPAIRAVVAV